VAFRLGVNYWPARTAMRWWTSFDAAEVEEDFARISACGMDSIRLFLLWEDFQPRPDHVEPAMLRRLVRVADIAEHAGLSIMPTLFTGHMSGVNWIPGWALGGGDRDERFRVVSGGGITGEGSRNWYADGEIARSQTRLAREAAKALSGHGALWAWDLGNENSNCVRPHDRAEGTRWLVQVAEAIRTADEAARVTIGLHMEDLQEDRNLGPREAADVCDFLTMHGYPIYATWAESATDEHLVPFLARLTRWLGSGRDVMFSEFGLPTVQRGSSNSERSHDHAFMLVAEDEAARYTGRALAELRRAGCIGAMVWCYSDYAAETWSSPPMDDAEHERSFGLWRADGSAKPSVSSVAAFAGRSVVDAPDDGWIDIERDRYQQEPGEQLPRLYRRYRERASSTLS
jgi:endo-1,4-beta-mannosidase